MPQKRLHIAITKTRLTGFSVTMPETGDKQPDFTINLELLTETGFKVTQVSYNSAYSWDKSMAFDVPARAHDLVQELAAMLHTVGEQKVQHVAALLEAPKDPDTVPQP